jgi:hypothetical protein
MLPVEEGRILFSRSGGEIALPVFQRDELARYIAQNEPMAQATGN